MLKMTKTLMHANENDHISLCHGKLVIMCTFSQDINEHERHRGKPQAKRLFERISYRCLQKMVGNSCENLCAPRFFKPNQTKTGAFGSNQSTSASRSSPSHPTKLGCAMVSYFILHQLLDRIAFQKYLNSDTMRRQHWQWFVIFVLLIFTFTGYWFGRRSCNYEILDGNLYIKQGKKGQNGHFEQRQHFNLSYHAIEFCVLFSNSNLEFARRCYSVFVLFYISSNSLLLKDLHHDMATVQWWAIPIPIPKYRYFRYSESGADWPLPLGPFVLKTCIKNFRKAYFFELCLQLAENPNYNKVDDCTFRGAHSGAVGSETSHLL